MLGQCALMYSHHSGICFATHTYTGYKLLSFIDFYEALSRSALFIVPDDDTEDMGSSTGAASYKPHAAARLSKGT